MKWDASTSCLCVAGGFGLLAFAPITAAYHGVKFIPDPVIAWSFIIGYPAMILALLAGFCSIEATER